VTLLPKLHDNSQPQLSQAKMQLTTGRLIRWTVHTVTTNLLVRRSLSSRDSLCYLTINLNTIN
jgi:hypothetical protein